MKLTGYSEMKNKLRKKSDFYITENSYYDEFGIVTDIHYTISEKKKLLGLFTYYSTVSKKDFGWGDFYSVPIKFSSLEEAEEFIELTLCPNIPRQQWKKGKISNISRE